MVEDPGRNVLLGVSGSVAAYRAADLARELMRAGCAVRVCLTDAAQNFVTPALFEALTGEPALTDTFEEPIRGRMAHIEWARWASVVVIAPATLSTIAKISQGIADDMLTTLVSATAAPLVVAPAMNPQMYASEANRHALDLLAARAAVIVEPREGDVACGEHGQGKLAAIEAIRDRTLELLSFRQVLAGKKVLVTSGPTQEPVDAVRYLSNRSSGKMGAAIARAALLMGAEVTVIAGPSTAAYPLQATVVNVRTAEEMLASARRAAEGCHLIIGAAAVADYRPADPSPTKLRRQDRPIDLKLVPNPDVIATLALEFPRAKAVGFAAEPTASMDEVKAKLDRKALSAIAANDISRADIGFETDENELWLVTREREPESSGVRSKLGCAMWLLERVAAL
jgi:phosphopantothenoylcysteine decarboxylase/phosphopantothenate--cysteine ligase